MTIQQAIEKAIEGGWIHSFRGLPKYKSPLNEWLIEKKNWKSYKGIFLDPLFWQSLGKAMGWVEYWDLGLNDTRKGFGWKEHWHRFIDHLAEGKDAESFFETLTK